MPYRIFDKNGRETKNSGPRIQMGQLFGKTGPAGKKQVIRSNVPNQPVATPFLGGPGTGGGNNTLANLASLVGTFKGAGVGKTGQLTKTVGGQEVPVSQGYTPLAPTQAAVTAPKTVGDYWGKEVYKDMPRDRFVTLMGMVGGAFGGDTPQGRLGTSLAGLAGGAMQRREAREAKTPTEWGTYLRSQRAAGVPDAEIVENYRKLQRGEKDVKRIQDFRMNREGVLEKGSFEEGKPETWIAARIASPSEAREYETGRAYEPEEKVGKTIDISVGGRRVPMKATPELLADIKAGRKKVFETLFKPEKEGWYTANVGGKAKRRKQTKENTEKYDVWQKGATKQDADVYKIATDLNKLQFDSKGKWKNADVAGPVEIIRDKLKKTDYEIVPTSDPAEKKYGWFGIDILAKDLPEGSEYFVIRKKVSGETRGGGEYRGEVPPTPEEVAAAKEELARRAEAGGK